MTKALEIPAIGLATPAEEVDNKVIKAIKNIVKDEVYGNVAYIDGVAAAPKAAQPNQLA